MFLKSAKNYYNCYFVLHNLVLKIRPNSVLVLVLVYLHVKYLYLYWYWYWYLLVEYLIRKW